MRNYGAMGPEKLAIVLDQLIAGEGDRRTVAQDGAMVVRALDRLTESLRG